MDKNITASKLLEKDRVSKELWNWASICEIIAKIANKRIMQHAKTV